MSGLLYTLVRALIPFAALYSRKCSYDLSLKHCLHCMCKRAICAREVGTEKAWKRARISWNPFAIHTKRNELLQNLYILFNVFALSFAFESMNINRRVFVRLSEYQSGRDAARAGHGLGVMEREAWAGEGKTRNVKNGQKCAANRHRAVKAI